MKDIKQSLDDNYLEQAISLAKRGLGKTQPNPMVGAIIVKNGKIIAKGYHHHLGGDHAEIEALKSLNSNAKGSTLYVSLEPCVHYGKTPPCIDAIINAGISRVVCCTPDPNPLVNGKGIKQLRAAGLQVSVGTKDKEARSLNEAYFGFHEKHRPFIAIKFAASLDGKIATYNHDSKWITNDKARRYARVLRSHYQAVIVGVNTVIYDNPHLGVRIHGKHDPLRIILDSKLRIPIDSQVLRDNNVLVITTKNSTKAKQKIFTARKVPLLILPTEQIVIADLIKELVKRNITSILVEGGGRVIGSFVDSRLVDKVHAFYGPLIIGGTTSIPAIAGQGASSISQALKLNNLSYKKIDNVILVNGYTFSLNLQ